MDNILSSITGGRELIDWFGYIPHFHDANLLEISLVSNGVSKLRIHAFQITNEVDDHGYFVLDKHIVVTITLEVVTYANLSEFNLPGIIFEFNISKIEGGFQLDWTGSYGIEGTIRAKQMQFDLVPGKKE